MGGYAWVTLATNDSYSLGALVLAHSLRRAGTQYELAVLVTPGVTPTMREKLAAVFSLVQEVNVLDSKDEANLALLARPELGITFTKLHCWRLTQYDKCVFLDADTLVIRNCDELFEREEFSAAPDVGWPDCFNSGVFVFKPSQQTFASVTAFAASKGSFDGGDQGLLNMYFSDWAHKDISKHLPFIYNMCSTATYSYLPAFKQFGEDVRIIHFIGSTKPWLQYFDTLSGLVQPPSESGHLQPLLQLWWNIFCENVHPQLTPFMAGLAGALAQLTLGQPRSAEQIALEEHMRKQSWEQGHIDYMGRDSFENIWKKICETLSGGPPRQPSPPKTVPQTEEVTTIEEKEVVPEVKTDTLITSQTEVPAPADVDVGQSNEEIPKKDEIILQELHDNQESIETNIVKETAIEDTLPAEAVPESTQVPFQSPIEEKLSSEETVVVPVVESQQESPQIDSEIANMSSVPIQVAESVLQAEPKESVSEDPKLVTEEAISSTDSPVYESAAALSELVIESTNNTHVMDEPAVLSSENNIVDAPVESVDSSECPMRPSRTKDPQPPQAPPTPTVTPPTPPAPITPVTPVTPVIPESPIIPETPIPTPTPIAEDTTPQPPPEEPEKAVKKPTKKTVKKTLSEGESFDSNEGDGKKSVKKNVKKVVKRSSKDSLEEGVVEGSSSSSSTSITEKPKPSGGNKGGKKLAKPSPTLATDTSIPDTPPPVSSPEAPVPPKRKGKTSGKTTEKSDPEP